MNKIVVWTISALLIGIALGILVSWQFSVLRQKNHSLLIVVESPSGTSIDVAKFKFSKPGTLKRVIYGDITYRWEYDFDAKPGEKIEVSVSDVPIPNAYLVGSADLTVDSAPVQRVQIELHRDTAQVRGHLYRPKGKPISGVIVALSSKNNPIEEKTTTEKTGEFVIPNEIEKGQLVRLTLAGKGCDGSDIYDFTGQEISLYCP